MQLKIEIDGDLSLWLGPNEEVQVPMCPKERARCRLALADALELLDQTIVKWSTFSTEGETDGFLKQSSLRPAGCRAIYDYSPPSRPPEGSSGHGLRIVLSDQPLLES